MAKPVSIIPIHEQVILGTMLTNPALRKSLSKSLPPTTFYVDRHKEIFAAIQRLNDEGLEYIPSTLKSFLSPDSDWGGIEYLEKLENLSANQNIDYHIEKARWDCIRTTLTIDEIPSLLAKLQDPKVSPETVVYSIKKISKVMDRSSNNSILEGKIHSAQYNAELYSRSGLTLRTSGYGNFDRELTSPFKPGWISVVAAAPSIGKTTFSLNMAARQAAKWKVGYLAWESGENSATDIIVASQCGIPLTTLLRRPDKMSLEERQKKDEFLEKMFGKDGNLCFVKRPPKATTRKRSPKECNDAIIDYIDSVLESTKLDIIYWDLFEKMFADRRPEAIMWALDQVQEMAQRHKIHIVLLHQILLKEAEKQSDKRPTRYNLKGSGGYIEEPDFVFGLYRKAIYERGIEDNEIELYCLKQRQGPFPFKMVFKWEGGYGKVSGGRKEEMTFVNRDDDV